MASAGASVVGALNTMVAASPGTGSVVEVAAISLPSLQSSG